MDQRLARPITDMTVLKNYAPTDRPIVTVPDTVHITTGSSLAIKSGTLIKSNSDPTVFLVGDNGSKRAFLSAEEFSKNNYSFRQVQTVEDNAVNSLTAAVGTPFQRPSGTVFKYAHDSTIYFLYQGQKKAYPSLKIFQAWNNDLSSVITIPNDEIYPTGNEVRLPNGLLVKGAQSQTVYIISNGVLRPFASFEVFVSAGYQSQDVVPESEADLSALGTGDPLF